MPGRSESEWTHAVEVIRRINPPESTARFFELLAQTKDSDRQDAIEAAKRYLREQGQPFSSCDYASRIPDDKITVALAESLGLKQKPARVYRFHFSLGAEAIVTILVRGKSATKSIAVLADPALGELCDRGVRGTSEGLAALGPSSRRHQYLAPGGTCVARPIL